MFSRVVTKNSIPFPTFRNRNKPTTSPTSFFVSEEPKSPRPETRPRSRDTGLSPGPRCRPGPGRDPKRTLSLLLLWVPAKPTRQSTVTEDVPKLRSYDIDTGTRDPPHVWSPPRGRNGPSPYTGPPWTTGVFKRRVDKRTEHCPNSASDTAITPGPKDRSGVPPTLALGSPGPLPTLSRPPRISDPTSLQVHHPHSCPAQTGADLRREEGSSS